MDTQSVGEPRTTPPHISGSPAKGLSPARGEPLRLLRLHIWKYATPRITPGRPPTRPTPEPALPTLHGHLQTGHILSGRILPSAHLQPLLIGTALSLALKALTWGNPSRSGTWPQDERGGWRGAGDNRLSNSPSSSTRVSDHHTELCVCGPGATAHRGLHEPGEGGSVPKSQGLAVGGLGASGSVADSADTPAPKLHSTPGPPGSADHLSGLSPSPKTPVSHPLHSRLQQLPCSTDFVEREMFMRRRSRQLVGSAQRIAEEPQSPFLTVSPETKTHRRQRGP